ncbi:MAG TPA: SemiSWEET family transporter [Cyclobacteriaceae bacterium]|nr:SemiSWEET family transporter [Cyclobacteriaceae bacterium]
MDWIQFMGLFGAFLTSVTFVPQVYRTWKLRSAGDISLLMLCIVLLSTFVWLTYAIALMLLPVIIANGIVCVLSLLLIYFKVSFK